MSEGFPRIELMVVWCPASQGPRARSRSARPRVSAAMFYGRREHAGVPGAESPSVAASPRFSEGGSLNSWLHVTKSGQARLLGAGHSESPQEVRGGFLPLWRAAGHAGHRETEVSARI